VGDVRGMRLRTAAVFLLIAAVLLMHGIPSMGSLHAGENGAAAAQHSVMAMSGEAASKVPSALSAVSEMAMGTVAESSPSDPPHGVVAHVWGACLAVLFACVVLGVAVLARLTGSGFDARAWWRTAPWTSTWCRSSRPPDLFALCVMRT
jgi:hypothetical protein